MAEKSLHGGPKRPFCENVKVNPVLCWRLKDIKGGGGVSAMESCKQRVEPAPDREVCCRQQYWKEELSKPSDIRHGAPGFGICLII